MTNRISLVVVASWRIFHRAAAFEVGDEFISLSQAGYLLEFGQAVFCNGDVVINYYV